MDNESEVTGYKVSGDRAGSNPELVFPCLFACSEGAQYHPYAISLGLLFRDFKSYSNNGSLLIPTNPFPSLCWHCSALGIPPTPAS